MESRVLSYVIAIAETGSFTAAAERCHLAQPSLSRQIAVLERELGETLFVRGPEGAEPTEAGRALLPYARAACGAVDGARSLFAERSGDLTGTLRLGFIAGLVDTAVPGAIARLSAAHAGLRIQVTGGAAAELTDAVLQRALDAAVIVREIDPLPPGLTATTLLTEDVVAVHAPQAFPTEAHDAPFTRHDLHATRIITYSPRSEVGRLLSREFGTPIEDALCLTDDQTLHLALAQEGAGTAITAGSVLVRSHAERLVIRRLDPGIRFRKRLIHRNDTVTSPALRALLTELASPQVRPGSARPGG